MIRWFDENERDLPWRRPGTSAWGVLLSEVMSQQTPVARVAPVWLEWMERWPTPADLAAAPTADVLRAWGSLGYPRRALRLKECATAIGDHVPSEVAELEKLPGIGEYTARAVACFAFGRNVPVVDVNVRRVYSRAWQARYLAPERADLAGVAAILPATNGPRFSAGLMELGALVCKTTPICSSCPLIDDCAWRLSGSPQPTKEELSKRKVQKFIGTDRQVRGKVMKLLRTTDLAVPQETIDILWHDPEQLQRAVEGLLTDGLVEKDAAGNYQLPQAK